MVQTLLEEESEVNGIVDAGKGGFSLIDVVFSVLALQENPPGCSSRMLGNVNVFNGFLNGSS